MFLLCLCHVLVVPRVSNKDNNPLSSSANFFPLFCRDVVDVPCNLSMLLYLTAVGSQRSAVDGRRSAVGSREGNTRLFSTLAALCHFISIH